jgi:hypothetical protein
LFNSSPTPGDILLSEVVERMGMMGEIVDEALVKPREPEEGLNVV